MFPESKGLTLNCKSSYVSQRNEARAEQGRQKRHRDGEKRHREFPGNPLASDQRGSKTRILEDKVITMRCRRPIPCL